MTTYRLHSSALVHAPGLLAWAQNDPCPATQSVLATAYPQIPAAVLSDLLHQRLTHYVHGGDTVEFHAYIVTDPVEITEEAYWEALECMPPSRFGQTEGVEMFHICEHLIDNLVSWYASYQGKYYQFNDQADTLRTLLVAKVRNFA